MNEKTSKIKPLAESAILVALAVVLSLVTPFHLPLGGSVTPACMLPILLAGIKNGPKWGLGSAFVFSVVQLFESLSKVLAWGLSVPVLLTCIFFDYIFAYSVLGVAGFFRRRPVRACVLGSCLAIALRFVCHFLTGVTIWATWSDGLWSVVTYSLVYNGSFMLPEFILTIALLSILLSVPQIRKILQIPAKTKAE